MATLSKILIIGGGIGGLTTAIALRQGGFCVEVFERASELKEIGAGISLTPNATRVLKQLGLLTEVVANGGVIRGGTLLKSSGEILLEMPAFETDMPSVCLHRADLQQILASAISDEVIRLDWEFERFEQTSFDVIAHFKNGRTVRGDLLIGADGLNSAVRKQLLDDGEPAYRGYQCWRGVNPRVKTHRLTESIGRGVRVGIVPLGTRGTGWWITRNERETETDGPEGRKQKLLRLVEGWHEPIGALIGGTDEALMIKNPIYDRPPVRKWSKDRCVLLGDAAHPTTPNLGQGGCMAIEDAIILTRCLQGCSDVGVAVREYERFRYARTTAVTQISLYHGRAGQIENRLGMRLRDNLLKLTPKKLMSKKMQEFVSYDACGVILPGQVRQH